MKKIIATVLCLLVMLCGCSGSANDGKTGSEGFKKPSGYTTVLQVTINPSFNLYLDADNKVLAVECVNSDAEKLMGKISVDGRDCSDAVARIVTAANDEGYVKKDAEISLLIVEANAELKSDLLKNVTLAIETVAEDKKLEITVSADISESAVVNDGKYEEALTAIEEGRIGEAYKLLCSTNDKRADELLKHFVFQPLKVTGENASTHTYDSKGYPATSVWGIHTYKYVWNADGTLRSKHVDEKNSGYWDHYDYVYENGLIKKIERNDRYDTKETDEYTYDAGGNLIKHVHTSPGAMDCYTKTLSYDVNGNLISQKSVSGDGSSSSITFTYDKNGNMLTRKSTFSGGSDSITMVYNSKGQLIKETSVYMHGTFVNDYKYTQSGKQASYSYHSGDPSNATVYTYLYDEYERRTGMVVTRDSKEINRHTITYNDTGDKCTFKGGGSTADYQLFYYPHDISVELVLNSATWIEYFPKYTY